MSKTLKKLKDTLTYRAIVYLISETFGWFENLGYIGINLINSVKYIFTGNINLKNTISQSARFGFDSLPITLLMVGISGMIIALQLAYEMVKQGAGNYVGSLVAVAIVREIGPIMGSFAVISMVGSSMAAEIGTMKVTEQIDAMKVLGINPIGYLIIPRILAGVFIMPFVITLANTVGIIGGLITSNIISGLSALNYIDSVWFGLTEKDIFVSLLKAGIFGGIIGLISSSSGYKTEGGAKDVGKATTDAVVWSFVTVVITDYIISLIFFE
ncbi:MAG: ABC transporter permease [bacterium]